jgi:hypothetical protein
MGNAWIGSSIHKQPDFFEDGFLLHNSYFVISFHLYINYGWLTFLDGVGCPGSVMATGVVEYEIPSILSVFLR